MGSVISVHLGHFLYMDPEEIWKWIQRNFLLGSGPPDWADSPLQGVPMMISEKEGLEYALRMDLGVTLQRPTGGRLAYRDLIFAPDRVVAEDAEEIPQEEAWDSILEAYLQLREAAAFALRMLSNRRVPKDSISGSHKWVAWEHGLVHIFPPSRSEQQLLERRLHEVHGRRDLGVGLIAFNERIARKTVFQIPEAVKSFPPLSQELGIPWSAGVPLEGPAPRTQLAKWLDVSAEEIVQAHASASRREGVIEVLMELDVTGVAGVTVTGKKPRALRFENGHIFLIDPDLDKAETEIKEEHAVRLVANSKLGLRRAAVYAAWVKATAKQKGISEQELIHLGALATYGYAKKEDVPPAVHPAIEVQLAELTMLYQTGLRVLAFQNTASG
jgi:hypothetical protein